jgi:alkylhydroperoxidase/carboxymuconolactone decarboxylase family protein YurZ
MIQNPAYEQFKEELPEVHAAFNDLFQSISSTTLDEKTKQLVYLGILTMTNYSPALRVHVRKALEAGATESEIKSAVMLTIPAGGLCHFLEVFPEMMAELKLK